MASRRSVFDPLDATTELRWYTVHNRTGALLESRPLDSTMNLKRVFVAAMLEKIDAGWEIGEFSSRTGMFYCTRGTERHMISIVPCDPHMENTDSAAHLAGGGGATVGRVR